MAAASAAVSAVRKGGTKSTSKTSGMTLMVERRLGQASERAKQMAAVILDVLGGNRTPTDAGRILGLSVARYYVVEQRAILGLVDGCEPSTKRGPSPDLEQKVRLLEQENRRLNQAVLRQQAIVRSTQRGLGISAPRTEVPASGSNKPTKSGKPRKARRPTIRALRQARRVEASRPSPSTPPVGSSPSALQSVTQIATPVGDQRGG